MAADGKTSLGLVSDEYFAELRRLLRSDCEVYGKPLECFQLAEFLYTVDKDYTESLGVFTQLCMEHTHPESCTFAGLQHLAAQGTGQDLVAAKDLFGRACRAGHGLGCNNLGMIQRRASTAGPPDEAGALQSFEQSCALLCAQGCFNASTMKLMGSTGVPEDKPAAFELAERGCSLGHLYSCVNAARMAMTGDGVPTDLAKAEELKQAARRLASSHS